MGEEPTGKWTGLDGLRALAVAAVVIYHFGGFVQGGTVGVDLFFVISGFLITSLLVRERDRTGTIALRDFWARRALRLFPALACAVALALLASPLVTAAMRSETFRGLPWVILYSGNWFRAFGPTLELGLLGHTWSLAVEEQFYLIWPIVCLLWLCRSNHRRRAALVVGTLAALDGGYLIFAMSHWSGTRGYFATDTHAFGLLAGAALALRLSDHGSQWSSRRVNTAATLGAAAFVLTALMSHNPSDSNALCSCVATAAAVPMVAACVLAPSAAVSSLFSTAPLQWLGRRSYGIYLYHYPIAMIFLERVHWHGALRWLAMAVAMAGVVGLAAISYRWVEQPFLRRKLRFGGQADPVRDTRLIPAPA